MRMNWWKEAGFRRFRHYGLIWIFLAAIVGDVINNWSGQVAMTAAGAIGMSLMVTGLGAFCEELFFRGLILRGLAPKGIWSAALITSLLFGLSHLMNAAAGMSLDVVLWQLLYGTAYGLAYAGFALRTGTIWPIMLTHFLNNFLVLLVSGWEVQMQDVSTSDRWLNIVYTLALTIYGIILIRNHHRELQSTSTQ
jgi:membrane protease YdiL (CAAX protease family)